MPLLTVKKKNIHLSSRGKPNPLFTPSIITAVRTPNRVPRGRTLPRYFAIRHLPVDNTNVLH